MVLSYRHAFHAGNFADVVKHSALSLILSHFHRKAKPFYYLDTHAGGPLYRLQDAMPQKTLEHAAGIGRVWHRRDYPREMEPYLSALRGLNGIYPGAQRSSISYAGADDSHVTHGATPAEQRHRREFAWHHLLHAQHHDPSTGTPYFAASYPDEAFAPERLQLYPGSALLASYFQRQIPIRAPGRTVVEPVADRMVCCELHSNEFEGLRRFFEPSKPAPGEPAHLLSLATRSRVHCLHQSGFAGLQSRNSNIFLAPKQGRGLVLVDPPYETEQEAGELLAALPKAYARFPHGLFAIWYPIIDYSVNSPKKLDVKLFKLLLQQLNIPKMLCVEFDMKESLQAARTGLTPEAWAETARQLPDLDASSKFAPERQRGLGMTGTGLILINPPYQFDAQLSNLCSYLSTALPVPAAVKGKEEPQLYPASFSVQWLTGERTKAQDKAQAAAASSAADDEHAAEEEHGAAPRSGA